MEKEFIDIQDTLNRLRTKVSLLKENNEKTDGIPYTSNDELMSSSIEAAKTQFGADFSNHETPMLYYETVFPVDAVNYLKENNITDDIYNDYNVGSYLIFNGIKVFVDPRCDLYSQEINNVDILKDEFDMPIDDIMEKYNLKYALLGFKNDKIKITHVIDTPEKYRELYSDDKYAVFKYLPNS